MKELFWLWVETLSSLCRVYSVERTQTTNWKWSSPQWITGEKFALRSLQKHHRHRTSLLWRQQGKKIRIDPSGRKTERTGGELRVGVRFSGERQKDVFLSTEKEQTSCQRARPHRRVYWADSKEGAAFQCIPTRSRPVRPVCPSSVAPGCQRVGVWCSAVEEKFTVRRCSDRAPERHMFCHQCDRSVRLPFRATLGHQSPRGPQTVLGLR